MTETLIALVPTYGPWLIFASVLLSCMAVPIPSSMLVMVAGGFAASGDITLYQVAGAGFGGFVAGDQAAFHLARAGGPGLVSRLAARPRLSPLVTRAEAMLQRRGTTAVLLSRTVFSPVGPYVGYLSGALGLAWGPFSVAAILGAALWVGAYSLLGYSFAGQLAQVAALISNGLGVILAGAIALAAGFWLRHSLAMHRAGVGGS